MRLIRPHLGYTAQGAFHYLRLLGLRLELMPVPRTGADCHTPSLEIETVGIASSLRSY